MSSTCPGLLMAFLVLMGPAIAFAQPSVEPAKAKALIKDLDSAQFKTRELARKELLALGEAALDPLKDALREPNGELLFRRRVERVLDDLKDYERDGETVYGLRLSLIASSDTLKIGDQMTLITTLTNEGKFPLFVRIGWQFPGSYFVQGDSLHSMTDRLQVPDCPKPDPKRKLVTKVLSPGTNIAFTSYVACHPVSMAKVHLKSGIEGSFLDVRANSTVRLRMVYSVEADEKLQDAFGRQRSTLLWSGSVRSNDVEVRLVAGP
jgi:hypothetical protein